MIEVIGLRLKNIRSFEESVIPIGPGLTVLMGRNNTGKSTVLRAAFLMARSPVPHDINDGYMRTGSTECDIAIQLRVPREEFHAALGFEISRVDSVRIGKTSLTELDEYRDWQAEPKVEVGRRWYFDPEPRNMIALRLLSNDASQHVEILAKGAATTSLSGDVQAEAIWFAEVLNEAGWPKSKTVGEAVFAYWEHQRVERLNSWIKQPDRRVTSAEETKLIEGLTFLKMKHEAEFARLSQALQDAFPEFRGFDFDDVKGKEFDYRPAFVTRDDQSSLLARESVGNGAWSYLSILTSARIAKATGARVLFLDEPHVYLHPGLERKLIGALTNPNNWDGEPLQIVAATHSPVFVDHAVRHGTLNILDWQTATHTSTSIQSVRYDENNAATLTRFFCAPSDLLYAEHVVFVEGPSDALALQILARARCKLTALPRFVPLRETDSIANNIHEYFSVIVQAVNPGISALLFLDGDKKADLERKWDKLPTDRDPRKLPGVQWANDTGNDLESVFCEPEFLRAYFVDKGCIATLTGIEKELESVGYPANHKSQKGCEAIRRLHSSLLIEDESARKIDYLEGLVRFYVRVTDEGFAAKVRAKIKPIEDALTALARGRS